MKGAQNGSAMAWNGANELTNDLWAKSGDFVRFGAKLGRSAAAYNPATQVLKLQFSRIQYDMFDLIRIVVTHTVSQMS